MHDCGLGRQVPCAGQRTLTASLDGSYERAESAGRGSGGEGDRVRRVIFDSLAVLSDSENQNINQVEHLHRLLRILESAI